MSTKHTPTPWSPTLSGDRAVGKCMRIVCRAEKRPDGETEANVALIVRAVNAHDALRSALRAVLETAHTDREWPNVYRQAREALALADG